MFRSLTPPLLLSTLLAACASPGAPTAHPARLAPDQLAAARTLADTPQGDWPRAAWWRGYGDPQLDRLVARALQGSPDLQRAQARLEQARATAGLADAARQPTLNANAEGAQQRLPEHYIYPSPLAGSYRNLDRAALDFGWDPDFWGRNRLLFESALGAVRAAEAEAAEARLLLAASVTRAYLELDRLYQLREVAQATLVQREHLRALVGQRRRAGLESTADEEQALGSIETARAECLALDTALARVRHQLAALAGAGPDATLDLARPHLALAHPLNLPADLPADLLGRRPDIVAMRWRVEAADKAVGAARADFYPNVNLSAFAGFQAIGLSNLFEGSSRAFGAGPAIRLPIFDGGRLRAQLAGRTAARDTAVADYNATLVGALQQVADQLSTWRGVDAEANARAAALARYETAWRLTETRYKAGLASYTAVLAAETPLLAERRANAELRSRRLLASADLALALGGGYLPEHEQDQGAHQ